jgi:hypothetical protein
LIHSPVSAATCTAAARRGRPQRSPWRGAYRLPWLLLGLLGALAFAGVIGAFEQQLGSQLLLAAFIPGVVYMADAVGTQTETLLIRGLSAGVVLRGVVGRELLTGAGIGAILALVFLRVAATRLGRRPRRARGRPRAAGELLHRHRRRRWRCPRRSSASTSTPRSGRAPWRP